MTEVCQLRISAGGRLVLESLPTVIVSKVSRTPFTIFLEAYSNSLISKKKMSGVVTLTSHLTSLSTTRPYSAATEHEFLSSAGKGTLSADRLALYLSQDRLYAAHAYPLFLGHILSSIPFSSLHAKNSNQEKFNQRIVKIVGDSLQNIIREVSFFDEIAEKFKLNLDIWRERKATRDYTAEMARVGAVGSLEEKLIFLWAMERVSLSHSFILYLLDLFS